MTVWSGETNLAIWLHLKPNCCPAFFSAAKLNDRHHAAMRHWLSVAGHEDKAPGENGWYNLIYRHEMV